MGKQPDDPGIRMLRSREPQAVKRWFLEYADTVYTFVFYRVGKDADLATEVVQETFLSALKKIKHFNPKRGTMAVWLTYVSKNCIKKALKERDRGIAHFESWAKIDDKLLAIYKQLATTPLPEDVLERQETIALVHMTLSSIPGNYKEILEQRYFYEQPLVEIARMYQISEGAARSLLHRARMAFKATFLGFVEA
jgi:RNA polymerase sigma-70 factor (ECF subfamily)